jgi:hypothetical protein
MARRRKGDGIVGGGIVVFFFVLAVVGAMLLTAAVYATPFIIVLSLLYYEIRTLGISKNFAFDADELKQLQEIDQQMDSTKRRLSEIDLEGEHLKRNVDGSFHRGSRLGMALDTELEQLTPRKLDLQEREEWLSGRPSRTFDNWVHVASLRFSLRLATIAYIGTCLFLYFLDPASMKAFSQYVEQHVLVHSSQLNDAWYGSALLSALSATLLVPIAYSIRRDRLTRSADVIMQQSAPHHTTSGVE